MTLTLNIKTAEDIQAEKADLQKKEYRASLLRYLAETDWYVIRAQETNKPMPKKIAEARANARSDLGELT